MGMQDRDWYREQYASKNGLRYNSANATYSAQDLPPTEPVQVDELPVAVASSGSPHWSLQLVVWLVALAVFAAFYRYSR